MKIINFKGGLGNQMFIYLFYLYIKKHYPKEHIYGAFWSGSLRQHSDFMINKIFDITLPKNTFLTDFISKTAFWMEKHHIVSTEENKYSIFFNGFWLDKKYWEGINLNDIFIFKNTKLSEKNYYYKHLINNSNSISVHVRRRDYQEGDNKNNFGDYCTSVYYQSTMSLIQKTNNNAKFFIFSDDIKWAKDNIRAKDAVYIDGNNGNDSWIDMYLMSLCHHNIIANSTFSYWAAILNNHSDKKVFYPKKWYIWDNPDIFPSSWTAI